MYCAFCIKQKDAKYRSQNVEKIRKSLSAYHLSNPSASAARRAKRAKNIKIATPLWFNEFDCLVMKEAAFLAKTRTKLTGIKWQTDHFFPLKGKLVSGLHVGLNISVIPASVNLKKGNQLMENKQSSFFG